MCLEDVKSRDGVGHVGGPSCEAVEAVVDAFPELVAIQPVLLTHIREHAGEMFREKGLAAGQLPVSYLGEGVKAVPGGEPGGVVGQEVIIYDVDEGAGVETIGSPEPGLGFPGYGMSVRETIYGAMEVNTMTDGKWVIQLFLPFYKITDQVSDGDVFDAEG